MLRILHSLPRTHKLLLLPVATMVTVLGTQKIFTSLDNSSVDSVASGSNSVTLDIDASDTVSMELIKDPMAEAVQLASRALDATREHVPIAELIVQDLIDIRPIALAHAENSPPEAFAGEGDSERDTVLASTEALEPPATETEVELSPRAKRLDDDVLHLVLQLANPDAHDADYDLAGGTSYDDFSSDPLLLFDDSEVYFEEELFAKREFVPEWETYTVQQGDTFAVTAQQTLGLGYSEVLRLLENMPDQNVLTRWRAGHNFDYQLNEAGELAALRVMRNARSGYLIERTEGDFEVSSIEKAGEATQRLFAGTVSGSFGRSAEATGLSSSEVAELSKLLEKKLDFRRDTRRGDRFQVLIEADVIDGQNLDSRVLAVQYEGARMDLTVVRNSADNRFYTPDGASLDPAFNRYPFNGSYRQSSSFNLRRKHPVTGRVSPHYGTDFAMPIGTPVNAPADGHIEKVGNHPLAGRFVVIRHDNGYRTRYLHLSQPQVTRGERVSMGEQIALSGNTGRSTGPHLHYEVIVNDNQVDPMRVELPENQSLQGDALAAFKRESERLLATLENGAESGTVIASTGNRNQVPPRQR
ncbi:MULTISPECIES: peptidoglycan DD-metalloendopeptidase family protein [Halomonadaceae]|uniref:peptidoglycan DD-metalloendopeptidase family protein n=1 Tax=Halomonadaceae TaxID=28256 RepID=UPI001598C28B|nr:MULTISPECIES: peptidoglycan DD-metalloendopeptidase family protein [Halomonas]QJQ96198.1 peptidoglycan DD-metalloendopeptidase family protein [Halomonas sp. PA5]